MKTAQTEECGSFFCYYNKKVCIKLFAIFRFWPVFMLSEQVFNQISLMIPGNAKPFSSSCFQPVLECFFPFKYILKTIQLRAHLSPACLLADRNLALNPLHCHTL